MGNSGYNLLNLKTTQNLACLFFHIYVPASPADNLLFSNAYDLVRHSIILSRYATQLYQTSSALNLKAEKVHYCLQLGPGDFYLDDREVHLSSSFAVGEGGADIARN